MKQSDKTTEVDLAADVIGWLQRQHWEVYPEVRPDLGGPRADIVAVQNGRVWVIECKMSFSLAVIAQANNWIGSAHWVSIATPKRWNRKQAESYLKQEILRWKGIGHLEVGGSGPISRLAPRLNRHARTGPITGCLVAAHVEMGVAGSRNDYYTPYRATCRQLSEYVSTNPGCSLKSAITNIQHHYAKDTTAISCLHKWIRFGKVPGVCRHSDGRSITLHPLPEPAK